MTIRIEPVAGLPEVHAGDDLAALLAEAVRPFALRADDVVVVTQKIVSKAEGRIVPVGDGGVAAWGVRVMGGFRGSRTVDIGRRGRGRKPAGTQLMAWGAVHSQRRVRRR